MRGALTKTGASFLVPVYSLIGSLFGIRSKKRFQLNRQEEEQLNRELDRIDQKEVELIMQITTSWHEKGKIEGKIEDIYKFMMRRFGANPNEVMPKIQQSANLETLDNIMEKLFAANTLEEAWSILRNSSNSSLQ